MKYKIFTKIPCLAKIENLNFELDTSNYLEIETEKTQILSIYPYENGMLPQNIKLEKGNQEKILFPEFQAIADGEVFISRTFNSTKSAILIGKPFKLICQDGNYSGSFNISRGIADYELKLTNETITLSAICENYNYNLIFNKGKFKEFVGDIKEEKGKALFIGQKFTICKHGSVFQTDNLEEQLVYLKQKPILPNNLLAKCFAFFEAIKLKDYNLARSFLNGELAEKLSDNHLKEFFDDFDDIYYLGDNKFALKSTTVVVLNVVTKYEKIVDIF